MCSYCVYSTDKNGKTTHGSVDILKRVIEHGTAIAVEQVFDDCRHRHRVTQVVVYSDLVLAVVVQYAHNIQRSVRDLTWDCDPGGLVTLFSSDGYEYWKNGKKKERQQLHWYSDDSGKALGIIDKPRRTVS